MWIATAAAVLVLLVVGVAAWLPPWKTAPAPELPVAQIEPPLPDRPSVAVLPFANLSDDPQQTYFADGIAEDLMTDLSRVSGLFVIARHSAFAYRGQDIDVRKVGRELGSAISSRAASVAPASRCVSTSSSSTPPPAAMSGPSGMTAQWTTSSPSRTR